MPSLLNVKFDEQNQGHSGAMMAWPAIEVPIGRQIHSRVAIGVRPSCGCHVWPLVSRSKCITCPSTPDTSRRHFPKSRALLVP